MHRDLCAQTVTDDDGAFTVASIEQIGELIDPTVKIAVIANGRTLAVPAQIRRQQVMCSGKRSLLDKLAPARVVAREAVQQHDRVTGDDSPRNQRADTIPYSHAQCR